MHVRLSRTLLCLNERHPQIALALGYGEICGSHVFSFGRPRLNFRVSSGDGFEVHRKTVVFSLRPALMVLRLFPPPSIVHGSTVGIRRIHTPFAYGSCFGPAQHVLGDVLGRA